MKIAIFEIEQWEREAFEPLGRAHELVFANESLTRDTAARFADADVLSTFIYSDVSAEVLEQFTRLKLIATRSTGYDHIAMNYCRDRGIAVCNVPRYGENTVAEHVFGLLLAISHNLIEAVNRTRGGDFSQAGLQGFDLRGKTLGVIGTGGIGQCVIEIAVGFRMKVLAYDVTPRTGLEGELGFRYVEMDELLSASDIITLHVPGGEKTRHMISSDEFGKMKPGVVLINTARGRVVDVKAMIEAISAGKLKAAGLDVLPEEPVIREEAELLRSMFREKHDLTALLADHVLLRLRNIIITPHTAFDTREAVRRILDTTVHNIDAFSRGQPQNTVSDNGV